ncbi:MAG: hypothetical protein AAF327_05945 [Cyanobacteria bacterium P01_A01_bin.37]
MGSMLLAQNIQTGDITLMSNVTSLTVVGTKVARLGDLSQEREATPSTIASICA